MIRTSAQPLAIGGLVGPIVFVSGWALLGSTIKGYSPVADAISEIARTGRPTHVAMTSVFVIFGLAMSAFALALRATKSLAWLAALTNGLATIGVAAVPLGLFTTDTVHVAFAGIAYVALTALPVLRGGRSARPFAVAIGLALTVSIVGPPVFTGFFNALVLPLVMFGLSLLPYHS